MSQTKLLTIEPNGGTLPGVIRVPQPGITLRFRVPVGNQFHTNNTKLIVFSNHSDDPKEKLSPTRTYSKLEDLLFDTNLDTPGLWKFQLSGIPIETPFIRIIVDPLIPIGNKLINASGLVIQTNYGRCIGLLKDWIQNLKPISELGYNMVHLPPFQELGLHSHYAIKDQLSISHSLFPDGFPENQKWSLFKKVCSNITKELGIVFMTDIVLNHTSVRSLWIRQHPECGYNEINSPHLNSAIYVDNLLAKLTEEIEDRIHPDVPPDISSDNSQRLRNLIRRKLDESELRRFFIVDSSEAEKALISDTNNKLPRQVEMLRMRALNYASPQRLNILMTKGIINNHKCNIGSMTIDPNYAIALYSAKDPKSRLEEFRLAMDTINSKYNQHYESVVNEITENVFNTFTYNRYNPEGPKAGPISRRMPIVWRYFEPIETSEGTLHLACNGWLFGSDPTTNFVAEGTEHYLRRQIIIWGDCIKLRYADDSPFLWDFMSKYVRSVSEVAAAIRIDNAHSTPIPVAEFFIKEARKVNPNLYVMAELFTTTQEDGFKYINHLGINSFLKEGCRHLEPNRLVEMIRSSGGNHVATVDSIDESVVLRPVSQIPGVVFDITHDNDTPRFDHLSLSAACAMAASPIATTRGYDDLFDFNPSVVSYYDIYPLGTKDGIKPARMILNKLHKQMADNQLKEILIRNYDSFVSVFRTNSDTGVGVWMIVRLYGYSAISEIECPSTVKSMVFEARYDNGLYLSTDKMNLFRLNGNRLDVSQVPEGSVICFNTQLSPEVLSLPKEFSVNAIAKLFFPKVSSLSLSDLSVLMFRSSSEEWAAFRNGTYSFPGFGDCFYAGTQGIENAFDAAINSPDGMASPVFQNLRDGNWLIDYCISRLFQNTRLVSVETLMGSLCERLKQLPRYLIPKLFDRIIRAINLAGCEAIKKSMSNFVREGDDFVQMLARASVALYGPTRDSPLVATSLVPFFNRTISKPECSLSAGLPHFASGSMRVWGRDTFIALRGIFLVTGRFTEARDHILAFASVMRHGLIPNLLDSCSSPRYNSRDSVWWFLQAIQDYTQMAPDGLEILAQRVPKLFPFDSLREHKRFQLLKTKPKMVTIASVIQEIMEAHANDIHFVEWYAGEQIDAHMKENGFHVDIITDWSNGFIIGGNCDNCGTWMDKMGSSDRAKNRGVPSTPRDGADIEIIGLLQSTLRWLDQLHTRGVYPREGVSLKSGRTVRWSEWSQLLVASFERWFYVPLNPNHDQFYFIESNLVGVRGIYKDTVGASNEFGDYQLRPNLLVAMCVAPELFDPIHAVRCLGIVEERIAGCIGMKTLDPGDAGYYPDYNNDDRSDNPATADGANYHNGPEWVWLTGFFLRASMRFRRGVSEKMQQMLASIKGTLAQSGASGLPELTNRDGKHCHHSCANQAWSVGAILDALYDYSQYTEDEVVDWDIDDSDGEFADEDQDEQ